MKIKISGYGLLKNYVGSPDNPTSYEITSSKQIKDIMKEMGIPDGIVLLVSVNDKQENFDYTPKEGDDVKLIPPVSGG